MSTYTYSTVRQKLSAILDEAKSTHSVFIKRQNGDLFQITSVPRKKSPLDVPSIQTQITTTDILSAIHTSRKAITQ